MSQIGKRLIPLLDRVLIERFTPQVKSKGGIMLPEQAQGKVSSGSVVAVGPGSLSKSGSLIPTSVNVGDKVLLPEYGGQKIKIDDKELFLFRDSEILGKWVD